MPPAPGRAALLLRRLSTGDQRFKQVSHPLPPVNHLQAVSRANRFSSLSAPTAPKLVRSLSDNIIKMASSSTDGDGAPVHKHTNRLMNERSPYLLQHAHNPVDWYPWGPEAIEKAKKDNKLIFLSVGYSTCHWCHVMEKESFENEDVANVMNEHYINIKVDREERPDVDRVYMMFVQATTGGGGWPMSVFLTPDLRPVTGGTYFPPEDRWGRPGFKSILLSLAKKWVENEQEFHQAGASIIEALKKASILDKAENLPGERAWKQCVQQFVNAYESDFGGFGTSPKFPQPSNLNFLFHVYARDKNHSRGKEALKMCLRTLKKMAKGGIHDHIGGGFARYSVDSEWHIPHFEKMLYDQAQLITVYTDAYLATKDAYYEEIVRDIIKYVNRDLSHYSGGFYSAEDADSYPEYGAPLKREGAFYVWEYEEIDSLLNEKTINTVKYSDVFCHYFNVEEHGNVAPETDPHGELLNKNVLIIYGNKEKTAKEFGLTIDEVDKILTESHDILYEARQKRPRPHLDSKIICSWNGLMISGLATAGQGLGDKAFVERAIKAANFIKDHLYDKNTNSLLRSCYRADDGSITQTDQPIRGFLDDYTFLIKGLLDLYEASLDMNWLRWARELQTKQDELFWDDVDGGYFNSAAGDPSVVLRLKEDQDGAEPCGNSVACHNLLRLAAYADKSTAGEGRGEDRKRAERLLLAFSQRLKDIPRAVPEMTSALMFYLDSPTQVLIRGGCEDPRTLELVRVVRSRLLPARVLAVADPASDHTPAGMSDILLSRIRPVGDAPTAYVCRRFACSLPVTDVQQLEKILDETSIQEDG